MTNKTVGKQGENLASIFLTNKGYKILEMNYKYSRFAEIDIIAVKNNVIHFVEVKTRTQVFCGSPLEAITPKKLHSIFACAQFYLKNSKVKYKSFQIDAIGIVLNQKEALEPSFQFIENISL